MSKVAYIIISLMMLSMVWYLFGRGRTDAHIHLSDVALPVQFFLRTPAHTQDISARQVLIDNVARPIARGGTSSLRKLLKRIKVTDDRIIYNVAQSDMAAYGILGDYELRHAQQHLYWGTTDHTGYLWRAQSVGTDTNNDNGTGDIFIVRENVIQALNDTCARFDDQTCLANMETTTRIDCGDIILKRPETNGLWYVADHEERPVVTSRANELLGFLRSIRLHTVQPNAEHYAIAQELRRLNVTLANNDTHTFRILSMDDTYAVAIDDLPIQALSAQQWQQMQGIMDTLRIDYLYDLSMGIEGLLFDRIIIKHGQDEAFRLQRYGRDDESYDIAGYSYWSVIWAGGSEPAHTQVGMQFFELFNRMPIEQIRLLDVPSEASYDPQMVTVTLMNGDDAQVAEITWHKNGAVQGNYHAGTIAAEYLEQAAINYDDLRDPSAFLNRFVLPADMRRVEKIQRLHYATDVQSLFSGELLHKMSQSQWRRSLYDAIGGTATPAHADGLACTRLAKILVGMRASKVQLVTAENIQTMDNPERGFDVHIAAWGEQKGEDDQLLEETLARDWGMVLKRIDQHWWAMNREHTIMYRLLSADVDSLFAGIQDSYLFPGVVGDIHGIEFQSRTDLFAVKKRRAWQLYEGAQTHAVDELQMRSYLHALSAIRATDIDEDAAVISSAQADMIITIRLPGIDDVMEEISLFIVGAGGNSTDNSTGMVHVSTHASSGTHPFSGVARVQYTDIMQLIRRPAWFIQHAHTDAVESHLQEKSVTP